ncbi:MAG: hypothetical protein ACJ8F7_00850 [Gemmataceae bacterium]
MNAIKRNLAVVALLGLTSPVLGRHVVHQLTPENIGQQQLGFAVKIADAGGFKEVTVTVQAQPGKRGPTGSADGRVEIVGDQPASVPVTRAFGKESATFTFRVSAAQLAKAQFTYTESFGQAFTVLGDYYRLDLKDFAADKKPESRNKPSLPKPKFNE